jgi:hypothetical protein
MNTLQRFFASLLGSVIFAFLLEWTIGFPPWNLTVLVIMILVMYEESQGWLAPAFYAVGSFVNWTKRVVATLAVFYIIRLLIWEITGFSFLDSLTSWKGVGTEGLFHETLPGSMREQLLVEIAIFIAVFTVSYMFAKEVVPPRPRSVTDEHIS